MEPEGSSPHSQVSATCPVQNIGPGSRHVCILRNKVPVHNIYLIHKDECLFVCLYVWNLYKFTFLNRSEPNFAHVSPLVWRRSRRVCMDPKFLTSSTCWAIFLWGPLQNHRNKMAAGETVFCDTLISVIPAGVRVTSPTLGCRRRRSHPLQPYIRDSSGSFPNVAEMTA